FPVSTIFPRYITAIVWLMCATAARSCAMKRYDRPSRLWRSRSRLRICARIETSRADTGSSRTTSFGDRASARAIAARCRGLPGPPVLAQRSTVERLEIPALEADRARRRRLEMQHELRGRRLATSRLADDTEGPAGLDRERDVVHGAHDVGPAPEKAALDGEVLGQVPGLEDRDGHRRSAASPQRAVWLSPTTTSRGDAWRTWSLTRGTQ